MEIHFSMEPELFLLSNPLFFKVYHGIPYVTVTDVIIFQKWNSIDYHKAISIWTLVIHFFLSMKSMKTDFQYSMLMECDKYPWNSMCISQT